MENKSNNRLKSGGFARLPLAAAFAAFFFVGLCSASILVTKQAPAQINFGETLVVNITLENNGSATDVSVTEYVGDADVVSPKDKLVVPQPIPGKIGLEPPYLFWQFSLGAGAKKTLDYQIKPHTAGYFVFSPTEVVSGDGVFYSNSLAANVVSVSNGKCEPEIGENYLNSKDCPSGSKDGVCDGLIDGNCDLDCAAGADFDCDKRGGGSVPGSAATPAVKKASPTTARTESLAATGLAGVIRGLFETILWIVVSVIVLIAVIIVVVVFLLRRKKKVAQPTGVVLPPPPPPPFIPPKLSPPPQLPPPPAPKPGSDAD
jgi:hypothetical protein